jgi:hypothetical protein
MVGMALAKSLYAIPTWTRTVALVREHAGLQATLGCQGGPPSEWACYRFAAKLREHKHLLDACIAAVVERAREEIPDLGREHRHRRLRPPRVRQWTAVRVQGWS